MSLSWTEACISVTRDNAAVAELALEQLGALAITFEDDRDSPVMEPGPGATPLWPDVRVRGLFESGIDRARVIAGLQSVPGANRPDHIRWKEVDDRDWSRAWMDRFEPMKFGRRLWIVPGGMSIPYDSGNIEIKLDPGLAFGTGTHPTTALCLEWLDGQDIASRLVVDYGCGSGVLGIAAAMLGAQGVICVDNDPQALEASAVNAERNGVLDKINCQLPESFSASGADIVLANILSGPLVDLAPVITACTKKGGRIVLSGLLEEQQGQVLSAYRDSCVLVDTASHDGWCRLDLRKFQARESRLRL